MPRGSGCSVYSNDALSTTKTTVFIGKGSLLGYHIFNTTAAELYVQFWDALEADVTVGSAPVHTFVLGIPAETAAGLGAGAVGTLAKPLEFTKGCVVSSTTTAAGASGAVATITLFVGD